MRFDQKRKLPPTGRSGGATKNVTNVRAGDGTRTHDVQLGKLAFYQLNYARVVWDYT